MTATIDLSAFFQTKAQATDFSSRIGTVAEKIYETNFNLEQILMEQFGLKKKEHFITLLRDNNVAIDNPTALKQFLTQLKKDITAIPILSLSLAFEPKEQTLKALSEWFVLNIKRQVLLEIKMDRELIAGAAISFNGKNGDFSIRGKFDKTVTELFPKPSPTAEQPTTPSVS